MPLLLTNLTRYLAIQRQISKHCGVRAERLPLGGSTTLTIPGCASVNVATTGSYNFYTRSEGCFGEDYPTDCQRVDPVLYVFTAKGQGMVAYNDDCFADFFQCYNQDPPLEGQDLQVHILPKDNPLQIK